MKGSNAMKNQVTSTFESLQTQAERAGYLVTVWSADEPHAGPVGLDHEARMVNVYDGEDFSDAQILSGLADAVAAITRR